MTEQEFNALYARHRAGVLDEAGYALLAPYKVDNAIIMAAGMSARCRPLSAVMPKGLFKIKGEVMLEREIEQILAAGVPQIVLVVGYLKEKFDYLAGKYGVTIIDNPDYAVKNNIHSLFLARDYMKNSYICCSDNYFKNNNFRDYVYDSYYACKYSKPWLDEFCVTRMDGPYIAEVVRGGENAWYTMGEAYFSREFSRRFTAFLTAEYADPGVHKMLMDDFHIKHIDALRLRKKEYADDEVKEFDTLEEIMEFDAGFEEFLKANV